VEHALWGEVRGWRVEGGGLRMLEVRGWRQEERLRLRLRLRGDGNVEGLKSGEWRGTA